MDVFKYSKLASESGKEGLVALIICAVFIAYFFYKQMSKSQGDLSQTKIVLLMAFGVFLIVAGKQVLNRLQSTGAWDIQVDDRVLQWRAPADVEDSFTVELDQIKMIHNTVSADLNQNNYVIFMQDGHEIALSDASGIDFDKLVAALQARGVTYEEEEDHPVQ